MGKMSFMVFRGLQIRLPCSISMKRYLPYKTCYLGSSYSEAYCSYILCHRHKLFAVLNLPVYFLLGSWYFDLKYAFKVYPMNVLKRNQ